MEREVFIMSDVAYALSRTLSLQTSVGYTLQTHCKHEKLLQDLQKCLNLRKHQEFILKKSEYVTM